MLADFSEVLYKIDRLQALVKLKPTRKLISKSNLVLATPNTAADTLILRAVFWRSDIVVVQEGDIKFFQFL